MNRKYKKFGVTLVELLAVLAIIALLTGILIPSIKMARGAAKKTRQIAQLAVIDQALMAFRGDYGDYPPSFLNDSVAGNYYCGAQKLSEALLGWDLLGFHPDSDFRALGDVADLVGVYDGDEDVDQTNLDRRVGPYLELDTANVFKLGDLWPTVTGELAPDTFVICDSFGVKKIIIGDKTVNAGTPILYYKADTTSKRILGTLRGRLIYNISDNADLAILNDQAPAPGSKLVDRGFFYSEEFIIDPKVTARPWPYRADSYILISAGADGLYGTRDDVRNFGN